MTRFKLMCLVIAISFFAACAKDGEFRLINLTNHNVYYSIDKNDYILEGNEERSHDLSNDKKTMFNERNKRYKVKIEGETFVLVDGEDEVTETTITIKPDKTLKAYLHPNRASLRLVNDSDMMISSLYYKQNFEAHQNFSSELIEDPIVPGDSTWFRLPASQMNPDNPGYFYYTFELRDETGRVYFFGNSSTVLDVDQQYRLKFEGLQE